ncbi:MAG: DinB family protein, partial [Planctomycetota bacterium]
MGLPRKVLHPLPGYAPAVGLHLAALEEARARTKARLSGVAPEAVDWTGPGDRNSIGTLLYHVAAIEMDWLFAEILRRDFPPEVVALFPFDVRDATGRLTPVPGVPLEEHVRRLDAARGILLQ